MSKYRLMKTSVVSVAAALLIAAFLVTGNFVVHTIAAPQPVIVELKSDPVVVAKALAEARGQNFNPLAYRQQLIAEQNQFLNQLSAAGIQFSLVSVNAPNGANGEVTNIQFRYNYVFNGLTVAVPAAAIKTIEGMSVVKSVHNDEQITMQLDNAVKYVRAPSLYGDPPQVHMGDSLNTGGVHGEGIYIAIIDTGIDWTHPMFGGDPTPPRFGVGPSVAAVNSNPKVPYYLNLTAGAVQDDFGHGTHVSGISAGYLAMAPGPDGLPLTADDVAIHGVAPQAKLMGYKVLSSAGTGVSSSIIMAIEDAVQPFTLAGYPKPVAQVINLSLGNTSNDPNYPTSVACDNATLAGTTVVAAAGNSGAPTPTNPTGEATIGSPGSGRRVLTIGATLDPGSAPNKLDEVGGGNRTGMKAFPLDGGAAIANDITSNYVYCGFAETPDQVPDTVSGKIALILRGGTVNTPAASPVSAGTGLFSNKAAFAVAKGAIAVVIYNNVDGELTAATVRKSTVPVVGISKANGEYLQAAIGSTAVGAISINPIRLNKALLFDPAMADFSSKGPVGGFGQIKPDVTAPGVNILSATVRVGGAETNTATMFDPTGYISASGTSMATPMTAGVVALVKQKNPGWTPSMIRAALMNTATNLRQGDGTPIADSANSLNRQGAGLVDAYAAANAKAMMGVGAFSQISSAPTVRPNNLCPNYGGSPSPLCGSSPGNPDFLASWSFGPVPMAGVIGTSTKTQTVTIADVTNGGGGGVYQLSSSAVRNLPTGVSVSFTDAGGNSISQVEVPANSGASFKVNITVNGEAVPADPTQIEWYVTATRTDGGQTLRMPFQYRAIAPTVAMFAPNLNNAGNTEFSGNPATDIDGAYQLTFAATGANAPAKFRLEESNDNGTSWAVMADVPTSQTVYDIAGRGNGTFNYRVRGLYTVENGVMPGPVSAVKTVVVDRRTAADVTSLIEAKIVDGTLIFSGGVWQFDQTLRNASTSTGVFAPLKFVITGINSNSGTVRVKNADDGGNGVSSPATFDYTPQVGADQQLSPGESTAARQLQFNNPAAEMFTVTAMIKGYLSDTAGGSSGGAAAGTTSSSSSGSSTGSGLTLPVGTRVMQITVNPLTKSVTAKLL
ncbi:MAG: minor extracellular serine protease Vpr [Blastocatellia bacterium]|jgi:subtilisin family serine protease|nr:minor extracellular serine protease Vpr [Blastocatellia bacterium]